MVRYCAAAALCLLQAFLSVPAKAVSATAAATALQVSDERRISFNDGWRFLKAAAEGAENPAFDDAKWFEVRLPHDWAIAGPFDPKIRSEERRVGKECR